MSLPVLATCVLAFLAAGYAVYSRIVVREFALDPERPTPACELEDGVDYVPTPTRYLLPQHLSAIAAAGPIAGPIIACQMFGWAPCIVWIALGSVFIGAVHDFSSLVASVRHGARSVAEIVHAQLGPGAWIALMVFIWLALMYVIVAFTDITASTFLGQTEELEGGRFAFNSGGAVAAAATMYLTLALVMGLVVKRFDPPLWLTTLVFVPATLFVVWLGTRVSTAFVIDVAAPAKVWGVIILVYCFVASLLPMWLLLQPRGYLGGFVLYLTLAAGMVGVFLGNLRFPGQFEIQQPAFKTLDAGGAFGALFPFLFVTIACGACSGFHGLVCSGTTSKQIQRETHTRPVGYGAMLMEAFVALIAMSTILIVAQSDKMPGPGRIFGDGIGKSLTVLIGPEHAVFAMTFGAMAFSTFVFDTLDVSTRLARYIIQELTGMRHRFAGIAATAFSLVPPALVLLSARTPGPGERPTYMDFWTLFGTSNQLLAALTLLGISVWMHRSGKRIVYTAVPMVFVMIVTVSALFVQARVAFAAAANGGASATVMMNGVVALALLLLAGYLIVLGGRALAAPRSSRPG
jgi:carbon starvation protein